VYPQKAHAAAPNRHNFAGKDFDFDLCYFAMKKTTNFGRGSSSATAPSPVAALRSLLLATGCNNSRAKHLCAAF
jgi:hypothetical protein